MTAPTLARPALTGQALADELERLGHAYNKGLTPDEEIWAQVDALAPHLTKQDRENWFEQLYTALSLRDGKAELAEYAPSERNPDLIERSARSDVHEAIAHLGGWS